MEYNDAKKLFGDQSLNEVVRKRIFELDDRFNDMMERVRVVSDTLNDGMENTYRTIMARVDELDGEMRTGIRDEADNFNREIEHLRREMETLHSEMSGYIQSVREDMLKVIDERVSQSKPQQGKAAKE